MKRLLLFLILICASCAWLSCDGTSGSVHPGLQRDGAGPGDISTSLPSISKLPYPSAAPRRVSATSFQLLDAAPVAQSAAGVTYTAGQVVLDAEQAGGFAWAIFALYGFPTDSTIYPLGYTVTADANVWSGYTNYSQGHWVFPQDDNVASVDYANGADMVSLAGVHYVALMSVDTEATVTVNSLVVTTSADLPDAPVAVLNLLSQTMTTLPATFSAAGSTPGGGGFESITYNWGDGTPDDVVTDPVQEVEHTYTAVGTKTVKLTVKNTGGQSDTASQQVVVTNPMRELLLVYNADIAEDLDLANYYASPRTGRAVDPAYVLGIHPTEEADPEVITWDNYLATIRDPIKAYLDSNTTIKNGIKYILLCRGIPHKIYGDNQFTFDNLIPGDTSSPLVSFSSYSSVDSDLCLLYNDYDPVGCMYNGPTYMDFAGTGFYLKGNTGFTRNTFKVTWIDYNDTVAPYTVVQYNLNYLVGRLSAYSYDNVKQMIDRSLAADTTGNGSVLFDSCASRQSLDTMVDPVWPWSDAAAQKSGFELMVDAGKAAFQDISPLVLTGLPTDNITVPTDAVIGYSGWGVNHSDGSYPSGGNYILKDLLFTYLPGACFISYESFNGRTFVTGNIDDPSHDGQGIIADFLYKGGTVAIGNANEPYTIGVGDERWVFNRYINGGDRWIEAAYKGLRLLSWQEVVVGDPLCKVK